MSWKIPQLFFPLFSRTRVLLLKIDFQQSLKKGKKEESQTALLMDFFKKNKNRDIAHPEIVDWAVEEYRKRTGNALKDPDKTIRELHQEGYLIKVQKGIYRYEPEHVKIRDRTTCRSYQTKRSWRKCKIRKWTDTL